MIHSTLFAQEPRWQPTHAPVMRTVPHAWHAWLTDPGSLTQRLIAYADGDFRVAVLREDWRSPTANERLHLGCTTRQQALVREVVLLCRDQPTVYARSVLPATTLRVNQHLKHLGNKPLGAVLFAEPTLARAPLQIARIEQLKPQPAINKINPAYARRSVFYVHDLPLLVSEIFLPCLMGALTR